MTTNDILRRLRYALNINDTKVAEIISLTQQPATTEQVLRWMKREDEEDYIELTHPQLCGFLDGLIIHKRGPHPSGNVPYPIDFLSTNEILKKLRIAYAMKDEDMCATFKKAKFVVTKAELGSFFRKEGHRNYRKCPEQVLRKFITGLSTQ